eukprot:1158977-Pelagomonas_calceolata.AAC.5
MPCGAAGSARGITATPARGGGRGSHAGPGHAYNCAHGQAVHRAGEGLCCAHDQAVHRAGEGVCFLCAIEGDFFVVPMAKWSIMLENIIAFCVGLFLVGVGAN